EQVIKSSSVDAILIATPTPSHADLIEAAAKAGKGILCEKPLSLSVERINACLDVVENNKSTLMIGFNRRFDPNFASVEARLRHGDIGEIEIVT
ncbi:Gfo/Idh/MocA family oxidoreductase, partial [Rhizobium ruizarguesonis]